MDYIFNDEDYMTLVENIINNDDYKKIDIIEHHGTNRYEHCIRVSYYAYKLAKKFKLDYIAVARAGLLHDFFYSNLDRTKKERFLSTFTHPKKAVENTKKFFEISLKEEDIIRSHMFPVNPSLPKYAETWLVSFVDKYVATNEFIYAFNSRFKYATNYLYFLLLVNLLKF